MIPIYSRRVRRIPYRKRAYKGGMLLMGPSKLPDYRCVQNALAAKNRRKRRRKRRQ